MTDSTTNSTEEQTFPVTKEELETIRSSLSSSFPDDHSYLSDDYIESVASKPYSKDPSIRRPVEYSTSKLVELLTWRATNAVSLQALLKMAMDPLGEQSPAALADPDQYTKAKALAVSLNYGSMYWNGLDKKGRPILWIRTNRMPWFPDVEAQVNALIVLADAGIQCMSPGTTDFVVLSDSNSPPPPNPQFMMNTLSALVKGYPDRLNLLVSCPVGTIIQSVMKLLLPLMPSRLSNKFVLIGEAEATEQLSKILKDGEAGIPSFMPRGTADDKDQHDVYFPEGGRFEDRVLKFDYDGMIKKLKEDISNFHKE